MAQIFGISGSNSYEKLSITSNLLKILNPRELVIFGISGNDCSWYYEEKTKYTAIVDGYLINSFELAKRKNCDPQNDAFIVLKMYQDEGVNFIAKLDGSFSLAIFDPVKKDIYLARTRPLFFRKDISGKAMFHSRARALAFAYRTDRIEEKGVVEYLLRQSVAAPRTIFSNVFSLKPGTWSMLSENTMKRYWNVRFAARDMSVQDAISLAEQHLDCVCQQLGQMQNNYSFATMSGGIDSTLCARHLSRNKISFDPVTYAVDWEDRVWNETEKANIASKHIEKKLTILSTPKESMKKALAVHLKMMDQPSPMGIGMSFLCQLVTPRFGLGYSGLGSDELFFGYPEISSRLANLDIDTAVKHYLLISSPFRNSTLERVAQALGVKFGELFEEIKITMRNLAIDSLSSNGFQASMVFLINHYLSSCDLPNNYEFSQGYGVSLRYPFLHNQIVDFALSIPTEVYQSYPLTIGKPILRLILKNAGFPKEIWGATKHGFGLPVGFLAHEFLFDKSLGENSPYHKILSDDSLFKCKQTGYINEYRLWCRRLLLAWLDEL